ncbi:MAG: diacylglycerol kinase, partial [Candidatus Omnitrophota bacterium]
DGHHPLARIAKDVAAGSVFVASINAVVTGYLLFSKRLPFQIESGMLKIKQSPWHITFICLILVFAVVLMAKVVFHRGTPLRGGMPSGHSAMAFSMWTIISMVTANGLIIVLTLVMAMLIARSRVIYKIHSSLEVIVGALAGTLVTLLVFQLLG